MKIFTLLLTLTWLLFSTAFGQKLNYDRTSKWFLGLNAGATWSSTDVKNETNGGWGITLGKSYNWNYGRRISFDIRARYLNGTWYGQDYDTSALTSYTGGPLSYYKDSFNMTVHNFYNDQHRLALELVLHANRFADRTGWDPYIFGGIGVTWHQNWSNLEGDSGYYNYPQILAAGNLPSTLSSNVDYSYETRLDGLSEDSWNAKWYPSLGFGLAYLVGPRFSFGIEHKTTFTGADTWDGVVSATPRSRNDWYHYTSAFLQFRFRTREEDTKVEQPNTNSINNINNFSSNCIAPTISIANRQETVLNSSYTLTFGTTQIGDASQVTLTDQNGMNVPFQLSNLTKNVKAPVVLNPGLNTFTLVVKNDCGTATETVQITYNDCKMPKVVLTSPQGGTITTVQQKNLTVSALIQNTTPNNISLWVNGAKTYAFTFNPINNTLQATVSLLPGKNILKVEAINGCGTDYQVAEVAYNDCVTPTLALVAPTTSGTTVNIASQKIVIKTQGFKAKNEFSVLLNGTTLNNFSWTNELLEIPTTLVAGNNTITVNGSNACGSESVFVSFNFQQCQPPVVTLESPVSSQTTVSKSNAVVRFKTINQNTLSLMVNNVLVNNYTFNASNGLVEYALQLIPGVNLITLTANNACGVDIETVSIQYDNCKPPTATLIPNNGVQTQAGYLFTATCTNILSPQEVTLTQNGNAIPFTLLSNTINAVTTLSNGVNTFKLTVTNGCGTQIQTQTVTYNNCLVPEISLLQPAASGISVNQNVYQLQSLVSNVQNPSQLTLNVNGSNKPFSFANGVLNASVILNAGVNNLVITAKNECGSDSESFTITLKQCLVPSLVILSPTTMVSTTNTGQAQVAFQALNCTQSSQIVILQNGTIIPFSLSNGTVSASATLTPGNNVFQITATNDCGKDVATFTITYNNCIAPIIGLTGGSIPSTVTSENLTVSATIQNVTNANQLSLLLNGIGVPFTFSNGNLTASLTLQAGTNSLSLSATNACGTDFKAKTIEFTPCKAPTLLITQPATPGSTVSNTQFTFQATVNNIGASNQLTLTHNGGMVNNFQLTNNALSAQVTLANGTNTFLLHGNNGCGVDQQITMVILSTCSSPSVILASPSGQTTNQANYTFNATVQGINSVQGLAFMVNGQLTPASLNNGLVSANVTLQNGMNNLMLSATNACGTDTKSIQVIYTPCTPPVLSIQHQNNSTVNTALFTFIAQVNGATSQQVSLTLNGIPVTNYTMNGTQLSVPLTLQAGANTIVLNVQNTCGSDRSELLINYQNCVAPQVSIANPNQSVTQGLYTFTANVSNMPNQQGISLSLNGSSIQGYNYSNGVLTANLNLANGSNTISVSAQNACGNDTKTATVIYNHCEAPTILVTSALIASDGSYIYQATITNVTDVEGVSLTFNGANTPFTFVNGVLTANVTLTMGANVFYATAYNNCGNDSENTTVQFANCVSPEITIQGSVASGGNTTGSTIDLSVGINGYDASTIVQATKNGNVINAINWSNGNINATVNLSDGLNTFVITATNACGSDSKTYTVTRCKAPTFVLINPSSNNVTVTNPTYVITFSVQNITNVSQVSLSQNGAGLTGLGLAGNMITLPVVLQGGVNTFNVQLDNGCGSQQGTFVITYTNNGQNPTINPNNGGHSPSNPGNGQNQNSPQKPTLPKEEKPVTPSPSKQEKPVSPPPAPKVEKPVAPNPAKTEKPVSPPPAPKVEKPVAPNPAKTEKPVAPAPAPKVEKPTTTKSSAAPEKTTTPAVNNQVKPVKTTPSVPPVQQKPPSPSKPKKGGGR
jgi:hypothetical protein